MGKRSGVHIEDVVTEREAETEELEDDLRIARDDLRIARDDLTAARSTIATLKAEIGGYRDAIIERRAESDAEMDDMCDKFLKAQRLANRYRRENMQLKAYVFDKLYKRELPSLAEIDLDSALVTGVDVSGYTSWEFAPVEED